MPPSLLARSLEPLVPVLWGLFLVWTPWVAAVWIMPIGETALGLSPGQAPQSHAELRSALLVMARHGDIAWLSLALMNLHLIVMRVSGLRTARLWLAFSDGGALVLGMLNGQLGLPFGWFFFGGAMGAELMGVSIGWILLGAVLVIGARETVLWARPRASHASVAVMTAALVLLTIVNVEWPARFIRGWWLWHSGAARNPLPVPWSNWVAWFVWPGLIAFAMREKHLVPGGAARSVKPVVILGLLNTIAFIARARAWLQG